MKCVPCEGGTPPLPIEKVNEYKTQLNQSWQIIENKKIRREFIFKDFKESVAFVIKVAALAENEGHHPDIYIFYNKVTLELSTHAISGLSENDFILAVKIDKID